MPNINNDVASVLIDKLVKATSESTLVSSTVSMKMTETADKIADNLSGIAEVELKAQKRIAEANEAKAEAEKLVAVITTQMQQRQAEKMSYSQRLKACEEAIAAVDGWDCDENKKDQAKLVLYNKMSDIIAEYIGVSISI